MSIYSRRDFLGQVRRSGIGLAGGLTILSNPRSVRAAPANEKVILAIVGCGGRGNMVANSFASREDCHFAYFCDVDRPMYARAKGIAALQGGKMPVYAADFRTMLDDKSVDAAIVALPPHWHALATIWCCQAGKDVYCEKPLTLAIDEGRRLVEVQRQTGRVLQTGTQQRSSREFRLAVNLVRNGRIGKVQKAEVWLPAGLREGPFAEGPVPAGFDYDFWLGQTPKVPYVKERTHFSFRYWWEYSGGTMTDWGAHHNDIVLWALDRDGSGPVSVEGRQLVEMIPGGYTAASEYAVTYTYADGVVHECRSTTASEWHGGVKDRGGQQHGIKFIGENGWIWVTRGVIQASDPAIIEQELPQGVPLVYESSDHMGNFVDCVKTRKPTICPAETGHRSASLCHLGVIAIRLGRKLAWNPAKEQFAGDAEANGYLARPMRKPYDYDML